MTKVLDIVVFGATGYTGKFVLSELYKLAKNLSWGIAGRDEKKLKNVLAETAKQVGVNNLNDISTIVADCEDEESIKKMTAQANVIINCCGPYTLYGEVVVKSCIETGTHYVDVTGEDYFIKEMLQKYSELAENKGVYIVSACGFGSIPADIGICFMQEKFSGTINSVEIYRHTSEEGGSTPGPSLNYGTWVSVVNEFANVFKSKKYTTQTNLPSLTPKVSMKLPHKVDKKWALPFPSCDDGIICRSQEFFYKNYNKRPVQMCSYTIMPSLLSVILTSVVILFTLLLAQLKLGRDLLLKYPEFFTNGICSKLSTTEKVERMRFLIVFKCLGWSDKLSEGQDQYHVPPNKEIIGRISGANPGYGFTATAVTLSALMILTEPNNLPSKGGICTPAMAFSKTSLVKQLQENGVVFEVVSIKDI